MDSALAALSPLDGRYASDVEPLRQFFSEEALFRARLQVEVEWYIFLSERKDIPDFPPVQKSAQTALRNLYQEFRTEYAQRMKETEKTTRHDVKAVEYFLKEELGKHQELLPYMEWAHFALTSEDVNNLAYALLLQESTEKVFLPELKKVLSLFREQAETWQEIPLLARTHGQPASPTTVGKVILNFYARLQRQISQLEKQEFLGKLNGATGNFNAHYIAFPKANWLEISQEFVTGLGLTWQPISDQIEPHDFVAEFSHLAIRMGTILTHYSRDMWGYISLGYFRQRTQKGEVGSSTMPHKVNPIDFENAEGNLGISKSLWEFFAEKLPLTRWQRDLTDSTVFRNLGVAMGHFFLALRSLQKGMGKLEINAGQIAQDLDSNQEVLAEALQTVIRKNGGEQPYEQLKELTRGKKLDREGYLTFVEGLDLPAEEKKRLHDLTPATYIGLAVEIVKRFLKK